MGQIWSSDDASLSSGCWATCWQQRTEELLAIVAAGNGIQKAPHLASRAMTVCSHGRPIVSVSRPLAARVHKAIRVIAHGKSNVLRPRSSRNVRQCKDCISLMKQHHGNDRKAEIKTKDFSGGTSNILINNREVAIKVLTNRAPDCFGGRLTGHGHICYIRTVAATNFWKI